MRKILSIIITLLISGIFIYLGITSFVKKIDLVQHDTKTIGYVRDNIKHRGKKSTTYRPLVEFKTADGQTHTFESDFGSNPPKYSVEQPVEVLYSESSPQNAEINTPWALWFTPTLLTVVGLAVLIFPLIGWIKMRKGA